MALRETYRETFIIKSKQDAANFHNQFNNGTLAHTFGIVTNGENSDIIARIWRYRKQINEITKRIWKEFD